MTTALADPHAPQQRSDVASRSGRAGTRRERRRARRVVWLLTALHVGLLAVYSLLVPTFRAPDEYVHVDLVREVAENRTYPEYDERFVAAPIIAARDTSRAYDSFGPAVAEGQAVPRGERPAFADLGPDEPSIARNPLPQHPPLYYGLVAVVYELAGDDLAFDRHVWLLRLVSIALVAPLPALAWATARRLGARPPTAVAAAALLVAVPAFTHIGSVVNNDNLLVLLGGVLAVLVVRVLTGDTSHRTALLAGLVCGLALLTKGFALALVPWAVTAYAFATRLAWRARLARAAELCAVAFAVGGWWWARNVVMHGRLQPSVGDRPRSLEPVDADVIEFTRRFAGRLFGSFWGSFGWREADMPWPVIVLASVAVAAAVIAAIVFARGRRARATLLFLVVPTGVLFALVTANAWRAFLKTGTPHASQGRYLYAGLVGLAVVAAIGLAAAIRARSRRGDVWLPFGVLAAAAVLHAFAAVAIITRYYAGDGALERLQALLAFAPWPPAVLGALVGAAVALMGSTGAAVWSIARDASGDD